MIKRIHLRTVGCAAALILASCFGDSTGPAARRAHVAFSPVFARTAVGAVAAVAFDHVRIRLTAPLGGSAGLDTVVSFPAADTSLTLQLSVPITGTSEVFDLTLAMIDAAGDTVYRGGPLRVTATVGVPNAATNVPVVYAGVGANAASVIFTAPIPRAAFFSDTATFAAQALDSSGRPIPGTPIVFQVDARDTLLARVLDPSVGRVVAKSVRGRAHVIAALLTGQADTTSLAVQPRAAAIAITGGNAQSAPAAAALAQPVTVRVKAADSLGVAGVTVNFAVATGGGSLGASTATTDSGGYASVGWTLGALVGAQTMTATVAGLTPATATATATGPAIQLSVPGNLVPLGGSGLALVKLTQAAPSGGLTVTVTSDSTQYVTVASPGTVAFAAGDTLKSISLNGVAVGASILHATATGYGAGVATAVVTPNLILLQQSVVVGIGQSTTLGITITPAAPAGGLVVTLASTDTTKLKVTTPTVTIPAAGTTGSATIQGIAAATVGVVASATGYAAGGAAVTVANAATTLALISGGGQLATPGTTLPLPIVVKASDALGNGVPGVAVTFAVATGGGSVGTPNATTNSLGQASTTWTLGTATGQQTITATAAGLTGSPLTVTANPSGVIASTTVTPKVDTLTALTATVQLVAQAKDASGGLLTGSFTWLSRAPTVATVSAAGLVTAVANGSSYVVVTEAGGTKDSALIVVQQRLASITVTPANKSIYLGASYAFTASGVDGLGKAMATALTFTWSSTAPAVATVDTAGHVSGVGLGTAQIKATSGTIIGVANVSIITTITRIAVVVDTVGAVKTDTFTMTSLGLTRRYRAIAYDTLNAAMAGITFTWVSTNGAVAVLDSITATTARATSAANGVTTINATAQGMTSKPGASLTVSQVLASIELKPDTTNPTATIAVGGSVHVSARGKDANSRYIAGGTFTYHSSTPSIATVDSVTGLVTGVAIGVDTVTATSGAITSNPVLVTVSSTPPKIISFGRDTLSVGRGSTASIPILLSTPATGSLIVKLTSAPGFAHWSTPTVTIGQGLSSVNATLVGDSAGTATVTATDSTGLGYTGATAIAKVTANMRLTSGSYAINATDVVKTQVLLSDPSPAGGTFITFTYSTPGVASVSPDPAFIPAGQLAADVQINGLAAGSTNITPTAIGVNGAASAFTVYAPVLTPSTTSIRLGAGQYEPNDYVYTPTYTNLAVPVTITSSDTAVVTVPPSVTIPASSYYAYFTTTAVATGSATLTFASTGWTAANTITVVSTSPYLGVCCGTTLNVTSPQTSMTIYTEDSLRTAHYRTNSLLVRVSSSDTTVMKVIDTVVTVSPGAYYTTARIIPAGQIGGTAWIIATASGHQPDSAQYTVVPPKLSFNWVSNYLGAGQYDPNQYVYTPNNVTAPLAVSVANSNPTAVTVPAVDTVPTGSYYRYFNVVGNATGAATFIASATGYQPDTASYTVTPPRLTACCNTTYDNFSLGGNVTVYTTDSLRTSHYRTSPLSVSVVSTDTTILKVDSSVVTVDSGIYYNNRARLTPVGVGVARIIFTAAGHVTLDTLTITVQTPKINLSLSSNATYPTLLGRRQHFDPNGNGFYVYTPDNRTSPLAVTITHNGAVDSLTTTAPTIPAGTYYKYVDAYGLATGNDTLIVSAPGYAPDTAFLRVTTPKFTNCCMPATSTTTNPPIGITVYATDSVGTGHYTMDTVVVAAASSDTTVIRPAATSFRIPKNVYYASTAVNVVGPGTASMTYSDSAGTGYGPTTTGSVTVTGPSFGISNGTPVLGMRQTGGQYSADVYTQNIVTAPLVVSLVSTDPRVVSVPTTVTIPTGSNYAYFQITALDTVGTIQIQATATGYTTATTTVQVTAPKFVLSTSTQLNTTSPASNIYVYAADANGASHYTTENVAVTLASSATGVATIDSPTVTIPSGSYYVNTPKWKPLVVGTSQLSASDPRAALYAYGTGTINVAVVEPTLNFGSSPGALGLGQYEDYVYVYAPDYAMTPTAVALTHTGTARTGTFTNLTNTPITGVTIDSATYYKYFRLSGLVRGTDTLVASATSPAHNPATMYTVVDSGRVDPLNGWPGTILAGDSVLVTLYARDPNTNARYVVAATPFTLVSNANIEFHQGGAVVTTVTIPADAQYVQFYVKGLTAGTGSVTITSANYKTYTNTVTVQ